MSEVPKLAIRGAASNFLQALKFAGWVALTALALGFMAKATWLAFRAGWGLM